MERVKFYLTKGGFDHLTAQEFKRDHIAGNVQRTRVFTIPQEDKNGVWPIYLDVDLDFSASLTRTR